jgi:hypothetical protein
VPIEDGLTKVCWPSSSRETASSPGFQNGALPAATDTAHHVSHLAAHHPPMVRST